MAEEKVQNTEEETEETEETEEPGGEDQEFISGIAGELTQKLGEKYSGDEDEHIEEPSDDDNDDLDDVSASDIKKRISKNLALVEEIVKEFPEANADNLRQIANKRLTEKSQSLKSALRYEAKRDKAARRAAVKDIQKDIPGLVAEIIKSKVVKEAKQEVAKSFGGVDIGGKTPTPADKKKNPDTQFGRILRGG